MGSRPTIFDRLEARGGRPQDWPATLRSIAKDVTTARVRAALGSQGVTVSQALAAEIAVALELGADAMDRMKHFQPTPEDPDA